MNKALKFVDLIISECVQPALLVNSFFCPMMVPQNVSTNQIIVSLKVMVWANHGHCFNTR